MRAFRDRLRAWPLAALLLLLAALAARVAVPAGFMPMVEHGHAVLLPCSGHGVMPMGGHHGGTADDGAGHADSPCGFAALADVAPGGADMPLLAAAIAYVMATGVAPLRRFAVQAAPRLRPPLRAPPA